MSTALEGKNAFKKILGFASVRDEQGEEMHKSKGNAIEFNEAADKIGVDVMRWLYLRQNPEYNLNFGYHVADDVRKLFILRLWNVYSFFVTYANINEFEPTKEYVKSENILDQWIISRLNESIKNVTKLTEEYNADKATEDVENFIINDLSNWFVRRSRERVNPSSTDDKDRKSALQTLWWVLNQYSRVLAPFIPFIAEEIYTNITNEESVHLSGWPSFEEALINKELNAEMRQAREVVEQAHAQRKEEGIKVRQPLSLLTTVSPIELSDAVKKIIANEVNVEEVTNKKGELSVILNTEITDSLRAKGEARDIVRKIQEERKKLGTGLSDKINVTLPQWPEEFEEEIKRRALVENLSQGEFKVSKI